MRSPDVQPADTTPVSYRGKRALDIFGSVLALCLVLPLLPFVVLLALGSVGSPVLFRQMRPGLQGQPFQIIKVRTMRDARGADGCPLPDAGRLTPVGRWLRASSLDELPQLWNILKGDMSFVGPRPLLMEYLPLYTSDQARRHMVCPGLTGLAQVNGRNTLSWEEKLALDAWYVDNQSLWLDIKIIGRTLGKVVRRDGISATGQATMPRFTGSST